MDLGTSFWGAQARVTLPLAMPAIFAAFLTAFTTSFDEFALTFFLIGPEPTLPTYLYSQLRFPMRLPLVVATASLIIIGSIGLILFAEWMRQLGQPSPVDRKEDRVKVRSAAAQRYQNLWGRA
jgi:spermidine/putrescine transport system permease protein